MFGVIFGAIKEVLGIAKKVKGEIDQSSENKELVKFLTDLNILDTIQPILQGMEEQESELDESLKGKVKNLEDTLKQLQALMDDLVKPGVIANIVKIFNAQSNKTRYTLVLNKLVIVIQTMTFSVVVQLPEIGERNEKHILKVHAQVTKVKAGIEGIQQTLDSEYGQNQDLTEARDQGVQGAGQDPVKYMHENQADMLELLKLLQKEREDNESITKKSEVKDMHENQADMLELLKLRQKEREDNESITKKSEESKDTVLTDEDIQLVLDEVDLDKLSDVFLIFGVTEGDFAAAQQKFADNKRMQLIYALDQYKKRVYKKANRYKFVIALGYAQQNLMKHKLAKMWGIILVN